MEEPKLRFIKNAEKSMNKIVIPKICIDKWGFSYYLEVYDDHMKLIPIKKEKYYGRQHY